MPEFAFHEYLNGWPEMIIAMDQLERRLRADRRPVAAAMIIRAVGEFRLDMERLAVTVAKFATETMRRMEADTRVRPDTLGGGGARLGDNLLAVPNPRQDIMPGRVDVADEKLLDDNVPWWITNEVGSSGRVGGHIFGVFHDQNEEMPPDADAGARREHPLFSPAPSAAGGGPGLILQPIPARRFITKSAPIVHAEWNLGFAKISARFDAQFTAALATYR